MTTFFKSKDFIQWLGLQTAKTRYIVEARLKRIEDDNHWGTINRFDGIIELKWASGLRVYTAKLNPQMIVLLLGGGKSGQGKDIKRAKRLLKEIKASHHGGP